MWANGLAIAIVILACLGMGSAGLADEAAARRAFQLDQPMDRALRQDWARLNLDTWQAIDDAVPRLTQSARAWLDQEISDSLAGGTVTPRYMRLLNSDEFQIDSAKERTMAIRQALERIASGRTEGAREELLLWAGVASSLIEPELWKSLRQLVARGIIDGSLFDETGFHEEAFRTQGLLILNRLVIRHLAGELPE